MKNTILLGLLLLSFACKETPKNDANNQEETTTKKSAVNIKTLIADDSLYADIETYYINKFSDQIVDKQKTDDGFELTFSKSDGSIASMIYISEKPKTDFIDKTRISGDLNNDKIADVIITIHTEGEGTGANSGHNDLFLYEGGAYGYSIVNVFPNTALSDCNDKSYFAADTIINNQLIGLSDCFQEGDAGCCPSLHFKTTLALKGDNLEIVNKTPIEK